MAWALLVGMLFLTQLFTFMIKIAQIVGFVLLAQSLYAQTSVLIILDKQTANPIEFATVRIENKTYTTKENGKVYLKNLSNQEQNIVVVRHLAYQTLKTQIVNSKNNGVKLFLEPQTNTLQEVVIKNNDFEHRLTSVEVSQIQLTAKQLNVIPSLGGEKDLVKALSSCPA